ncbi:hypothetical protein HK100_012828, partial [Physocladia obscura]
MPSIQYTSAVNEYLAIKTKREDAANKAQAVSHPDGCTNSSSVPPTNLASPSTVSIKTKHNSIPYVAPSATLTTITTTTTTSTTTTVEASTTADDVLTTVETATIGNDGPAPAGAPQSQVDVAAAPATTFDVAAPAPAPQSQVDAPATTTTADAAVAASSAAAVAPATTTTSAAVSSGDIADPNIPSASDLPTPATNGCNGDNLSICKSIAATDYQNAAAAAASVSSDFNQACLDLNNHARYLYGNPNPYLVWNEDLANWAVVSAAYANYLGCWDCHSYSAGSLPWGQNLYVGESTCADAYYGWVTQEALGDGAAGETGHFLNAAGWAIDPSGGTGYTQIGCGAYGDSIVCNFGLGDVSGGLASLPVDFNAALALALQGTVYTCVTPSSTEAAVTTTATATAAATATDTTISNAITIGAVVATTDDSAAAVTTTQAPQVEHDASASVSNISSARNSVTATDVTEAPASQPAAEPAAAVATTNLTQAQITRTLVGSRRKPKEKEMLQGEPLILLVARDIRRLDAVHLEIMCNFGFGDVSSALANMPTDYCTALALALHRM